MLLFRARTIVRDSDSTELARLKKERKKKKENISPVLRVPGLVLLRGFLAPLGVLLVKKTLDDEWYVVIKAYKLTIFEIFRNVYILHVRAIPTLESYRLL